MNGRKSKRIRKLVFGKDGSHRVRDYFRNPITGKITGGHLRGMYQRLKRDAVRTNLTPEYLLFPF